jgi:hypothetical protein
VLWPTSTEVMAEYQQNDDSLRQIIQLCSDNGELKCNWNKDQYCLQQNVVGILYREVSGEPKDSVRYQLVVPRDLQFTCMKLFHEGRCLDTIKLYYYWDGMRKDNLVGECVACRLRKAYQGRPMIPIMKYPRVYGPLERLHFDLTGPLVSTKSGFKYILVDSETEKIL